MSTSSDITHIELSDTLTLSEFKSPKNGRHGFWLYDTTRGMNLSMRAKSSTEAFVEALTYYQRRLLEIELALRKLNTQVDTFVSQVRPEEEHDDD